MSWILRLPTVEPFFIKHNDHFAKSIVSHKCVFATRQVNYIIVEQGLFKVFLPQVFEICYKIDHLRGIVFVTSTLEQYSKILNTFLFVHYIPCDKHPKNLSIISYS